MDETNFLDIGVSDHLVGAGQRLARTADCICVAQILRSMLRYGGILPCVGRGCADKAEAFVSIWMDENEINDVNDYRVRGHKYSPGSRRCLLPADRDSDLWEVGGRDFNLLPHLYLPLSDHSRSRL